MVSKVAAAKGASGVNSPTTAIPVPRAPPTVATVSPAFKTQNIQRNKHPKRENTFAN